MRAGKATAAGASRATLRMRVRYSFDNTLSRGMGMVVVWLSVLAVVLAIFATAVVHFTGLEGINGKKRLNLGDTIWESMLRVLGRGGVGADTGWGTRVFGFAMMVVGFGVGAMVFGLVSTAFREKMLNLRKGRSFVVEHDHTVILGWSSRVGNILSELVVANASRKRAAVVILADRGREAMEDDLRKLVKDLGTTRRVPYRRHLLAGRLAPCEHRERSQRDCHRRR